MWSSLIIQKEGFRLIINKNYKVEPQDTLNVVLFERKVVKEGDNAGQENWKPIAYCPNVKIALKTLVDREINGTGLKDFETVVKKYDELMATIEKLQV